MKENASLLNCRNAICDALNAIPTSDKTTVRRDLVFAISELDAFRHGRLQKCDTCPDTMESEDGP